MGVMVYAYLRWSTDKQTEGDSLKRQLSAIQAYCDRNRLKLDKANIYKDEGVSGFSGSHRSDDRYQLAAFVEMVERGDVKPGSYLIVENMDRLTREDPINGALFFFKLLAAGVVVITVSPEMKYTKDNPMMAMMMGSTELLRGNAESDRLRVKITSVWAGKKAAARASGTPTGRNCPNWLELVGGAYKVMPERAKIVQRIFRECIGGLGIGGITKGLNRDTVPGFSRRSDKPSAWTAIQVSHILRHKATFGLKIPGSFVGKKRVKDEEPITGFFPPVIEEATFWAAQAAMKGRNRTGGKAHSASANVFTGLIFDGEDDSRWSMITQGHGMRSKLLVNRDAVERNGERKTIRYEPFESVFFDQIKAIKSSDMVDTTKSSEAEQVDELAREIQEIDEGLTVIRAGLSNAKKVSPTLVASAASLEEQREAKVEQMEALKRELATPATVALANAKDGIEGLLKDTGNEELRRKLRARIGQLVERITVWHEQEAKGGRLAKRTVFVRVRLKNGYGVQYAITYAPATRHYLEKVEVSPWIGDRHILTGTHAHIIGKPVPLAKLKGGK